MHTIALATLTAVGLALIAGLLAAFAVAIDGLNDTSAIIALLALSAIVGAAIWSLIEVLA